MTWSPAEASTACSFGGGAATGAPCARRGRDAVLLNQTTDPVNAAPSKNQPAKSHVMARLPVDVCTADAFRGRGAFDRFSATLP